MTVPALAPARPCSRRPRRCSSARIAGSRGTLAATFARDRRWCSGRRRPRRPSTAPRARRTGCGCMRRGSGGGAVLCDPGLLEVDVALPAGHALLVDDVTESYRFLGPAWIEALSVARHRGPARDGRRGPGAARRAAGGRAVACYAGLSPYEVVDAHGAKLVGLCQRRRRGAALFQCSLACGRDPATSRATCTSTGPLAGDPRGRPLAPTAAWAALEPLLGVL